MLASIDDLISKMNQPRSVFIREACHFYIEEKRKQQLREKMKVGYQEMAELNRLLAEEIACDFDCVPRALNVREGFNDILGGYRGMNSSNRRKS